MKILPLVPVVWERLMVWLLELSGIGGGGHKASIKNTPGNEVREHRMEGEFPVRHCLQGAAPRYRDHVH